MNLVDRIDKFSEHRDNVTNPYLLASIISARDMVQPSQEEVKPSPLIGKVLGVSGLLYAVGFVSLNLTYYFWGFHDLNLSHQQCIYAGVWTLLFFSVSCLIPTGILDLGKRFLHTGFRAQGWKWAFSAAYCTGLLLLFWLRSWIAPFAKSHIQGIALPLIAIAASNMGFALWIFLLAARSLFNFKNWKGHRD